MFTSEHFFSKNIPVDLSTPLLIPQKYAWNRRYDVLAILPPKRAAAINCANEYGNYLLVCVTRAWRTRLSPRDIP